MNDIIEHYGKVVVALAGVLAAVLLTVAVVGMLIRRQRQRSKTFLMKSR